MVKSDIATEETRQKICTYIRSGFSWSAPRKGGEEAWKEFFTGNISLLGKGVEK